MCNPAVFISLRLFFVKYLIVVYNFTSVDSVEEMHDFKVFFS